MDYIDLHIHTEYTKGNGVTNINDLVKRAKEYEMDSLTITDSGTIKGFSEFYKECANNNIKPILGCGFYFAPLGLENPVTHHLVLIAKDINGYNNLLRLNEYSLNEGFGFGKPRIDFSVLNIINSHMFCLTGGLGGVFDKPYLSGDRELAISNIIELKKVFRESFFLELQDNGLENNSTMRKVLKQQSEELNLELVVTGGSFYLNKEDSERCNILRKQNGNKELIGNGYYFKSPEEIGYSFSEYPKAISNSVYIAERCNLKLDCFS